VDTFHSTHTGQLILIALIRRNFIDHFNSLDRGIRAINKLINCCIHVFVTCYIARRITVAVGIDLSLIRFVCLCVRKVYCGKTAKWIRMPFGVVSGVGRGIGVLDGDGDRRRERAVLGVNLGRPESLQ